MKNKNSVFLCASTGMLFGAKQTGLDKFGGKSAQPFNQFSSGMGSNGLIKAYDARSKK